jgi:hypothetical protein
MKQIAQGDIFYAKVEDAPKKLKFKKVNKFTVAVGEAVGARHRVEVIEKSTMEIAEAGNGLFYLKIDGEAMLRHPEHKPDVKLTTGMYFVSRQIEFSPQETRLVKD